LSSTPIPEITSAPPRKLAAWLPTLLWLCVLAFFSTDIFSAEHTGSVLQKLLHALFGGISHHTFVLIHFYVRKTAHFCSYGLLSGLSFFSWRATFFADRPWMLRWAVLGLVTGIAGGCLDEFHQSFLSSRTSSMRDVLIDTAGALFFQLAIAAWMSFRANRASTR